MATSLHYSDTRQYRDSSNCPPGENCIQPIAANSMTKFFRHELGLSWLHPAGIDSTAGLLSIMDLQPWMRVLDVGCGLGASSRYIAENYGCEVVALDRDLDMLAEAGRRTPPSFRRISYENGDFLEHDFAENSFDAIIMESVLWDNDKLAFLQRAQQLLKPWGQLGINESTWLTTPSDHARQICETTICESFSDTLPQEAWLSLIEKAGLFNIDHRVDQLKSFSVPRLLREEGLLGTLAVLNRFYHNREAQRRVDEFRTFVQAYPDHFGYGVYLAWKPGH